LPLLLLVLLLAVGEYCSHMTLPSCAQCGDRVVILCRTCKGCTRLTLDHSRARSFLNTYYHTESSLASP
jgi:hypothetical protein